MTKKNKVIGISQVHDRSMSRDCMSTNGFRVFENRTVVVWRDVIADTGLKERRRFYFPGEYSWRRIRRLLIKMRNDA